jgi:hypothetical protein
VLVNPSLNVEKRFGVLVICDSISIIVSFQLEGESVLGECYNDSTVVHAVLVNLEDVRSSLTDGKVSSAWDGVGYLVEQSSQSVP